MKTIPAALQAHYDSGETTIAHAILIERNDGQIYGFTSNDQNLMLDLEPWGIVQTESIANPYLDGRGLDSQASNVTLMLRFDPDYNADLNLSVIEKGSVTYVGSATNSSNQFKFGSKSLLLNGTDSYLRADESLDTLTSATAAFTMECHLYRTATGTNPYVFGANLSSSGANTFTIGTNEMIIGNGSTVTYSSGVPLNQWVHFAACFDGTTTRIFIDGTQVASTTTLPGSALSDCNFAIGAEFDAANAGTPGNYFPGYIDDVRITTNHARYTSNFIAPTQAAQAVVSNLTVKRKQLFDATQGLEASSIVTTSGFGVDNLELTTLDDGSLFTTDDILQGRWRNAKYRIFRYNWSANPITIANDVETLMRGTFGEITINRDTIKLELRGLTQKLQQPVGVVSTKTCRARLGDGKCKKDLTAFTHGGTVTSVTSTSVFTASSLTQAADYFTEGIITWTSGNNNGISEKIRLHEAGGKISLILPMVRDIQVGNSFTIVAGCNKTLETCKVKFNNVLNFQGEPHRPMVDKIVKPVTPGAGNQ